MSHIHPISTPSNFQLIFDNALNAYKRRTKIDLFTHPLADRLEPCDSASSILIVLHEHVQELNQSQLRNETWIRWLDPSVKVLHAFSEILGRGLTLAFPPAKPIFTAVGVLLSTAKNVRASEVAVFEIFERLEAFLQRLEIYTKAALDQNMVDTVTKIMVEVLNVIGIATKEIHQNRRKKYLKTLFGNRATIEDALKRLDSLTQEEAQMAAAQILKATYIVDETGSVRGVADITLSVGNRVVEVGDQVQGVSDQVQGVKRSQLRQDLRRWLSPPDPSTNHNIACSSHHSGTATWFFEGGTYKEWKSTGSEPLLWIHGKPGSGKSILCSTIIEDLKMMCIAGQASMAYFYFDFRDVNKQHWRDLVPSLLTQLSFRSGPLCDILSRLYFDHEDGAQQPNDETLTQCLKEMLEVPDQRPTYLIIDALDECSDVSGIPTSRKQVLQLVKELVNLHIPNLHICVTSRPEVDIRDVLEPLTSCRVSLHDQSGQKKDIEDYVRSVVYSNSEPIMRRWRKEDKELFIETLSERADGMFRWIFCQLEVLRDCLPSSVRQALMELPESLDETYERILKEIKKPNRALARRVLQCLVVATRPLRVAELAEVLAVDFDDAEGIPRLNSDWCWEDQEHALLIACSSLIAIVEAGDVKASNGDSDSEANDSASEVEAGDGDRDDDSKEDASESDLDVEADHSDSDAENDDGHLHVDAGDFRIVQFSHFSVKEFLTSPRLATAGRDVSNFHIDLGSAHTTLGQACLGVLLRIQDDVDGHTPKDHPLVRYAAEHWVTHAQFGEVSSCFHKGMEYLFDANKPHFRVWLTLCDIDRRPDNDTTFFSFAPYGKSRGVVPLYYAALGGFHDLVEHLVIKYPQDVNVDGGYYMRPLVAALAGKHFQIADLLHHNGADPQCFGHLGNTPLHSATRYGSVDVVQKLIEYDADINAKNEVWATPLHWAPSNDHQFKDGSALRLLLEHGADINARASNGRTPLHVASSNGVLRVVRLLLEYGADVEMKRYDGKTSLQEATKGGHDEVAELLREHGAK